MGKPVVHFEIGCDNLTETVIFYKEIFNWSISPKGSSATIDFDKENGIPGHITELGHEPRKYITIYIETDTIEADLEQIEKKGGKTLVQP